MNETKQRQVIAEEAGWYVIESDEGSGVFSIRPPTETNRYPWRRSEEEAFEDGPDFLNDLNAMQEVNREFPAQFRDELAHAIAGICSRDYLEDKHWSQWPQFATAKQRAEAFLRTIGKWEEES